MRALWIYSNREAGPFWSKVMALIIVESAALHRERRRAVRRLVAPLLPQPPSINVEQVGLGRDTYTIGVLPNGRQPSSYLNPEEALVPTRVPNLLMNYYETWRKGTEADGYYLDRAYMHIHLATRSLSQQIFSLHCDPHSPIGGAFSIQARASRSY